MALTKDKKHEIVDETVSLLSSSKLTVIASYPGTSVSAMQSLRRDAKPSDTVVRVIKNRLVIKALEQAGTLKNINPELLRGQLLYAFNSNDDVAPAQVLDKFAKENQTLEFIGGISADGQFISAADVANLAGLPNKDQLRAMLLGTLKAPLNGMANILAANTRGLVQVLNAHGQEG